jgi:hypothetical protein
VRLPGNRRVWQIAGLTTLSVTALTGGVLIAPHLGAPASSPPAGQETVVLPPLGPASPPPPPGSAGPAGLAVDFAQLESGLHASAGIVIGAVGTDHPPIVLGDWQKGPAWSTIKVPLAIAALREQDTPVPTAAMSAAITESDNAAAESIWAGLGDPVTAAHKVEDVLRKTGDPTVVQSQKVRPEFTAFGQTDWPLTEQVRFLSAAVCDDANGPIFDLMGKIDPTQSWGIGTIANTRFKGGWGPSLAGSYLVRQIGVLNGPTGMVAVALAVQPASGKFDDGTADLTQMATWLRAHLGSLPAGQCAP